MKMQHTDETIQVRFSDHCVPFELTTAFCTNPECDCREISLRLKAQSDENPLQFSLTVDLDSWTERKAPERDTQVSHWVNEFLDELPAEEKRSLYNLYDAKFADKRLQSCILSRDDVLGGALISYTNIVSENKSIYEGGTSCISRFEHNDTEYAIDALYCPNPKCHCDEAHLFIIRLNPEQQDQIAATSAANMLVKLTFAGNWHIEERWEIPLAEAKQLMTTWLEKTPWIIDRLKREYEAIKEVGARSLEQMVPEMSFFPHEPIVREKKIGRNEPCICGSGKKYKKCCGA